MTQRHAHFHELRHTGINRSERIVGQQVLGQVLRDELALHVVAAEAEGGLGEIVGAEGEEVGLLGDLVGR